MEVRYSIGLHTLSERSTPGLVAAMCCPVRLLSAPPTLKHHELRVIPCTLAKFLSRAIRQAPFHCQIRRLALASAQMCHHRLNRIDLPLAHHLELCVRLPCGLSRGRPASVEAACFKDVADTGRSNAQVQGRSSSPQYISTRPP